MSVAFCNNTDRDTLSGKGFKVTHANAKYEPIKRKYIAVDKRGHLPKLHCEWTGAIQSWLPRPPRPNGVFVVAETTAAVTNERFSSERIDKTICPAQKQKQCNELIVRHWAR